MPTLTSLSRQFDAALNQFKALDLGTTPGGGCYLEPYDPKKPYYPSIYISDKPDSMEDIPEDGTALVKYKVTSRSTNERNGKKRHSLSLDVLSFDPQGTKKEDAKKKAEGKAVPVKTEMRTGVSALPSHEFARTATALLKTRRVPLVMKKTGHGGEIRVSYRKKAVPDAGRREATAYYTDDVKDARSTAAHLAREVRSQQRLAKAMSLKTGGKPPSMDRVPFGFSEFARGDQVRKLMKAKDSYLPSFHEIAVRRKGWAGDAYEVANHKRLRNAVADYSKRLRAKSRGSYDAVKDRARDVGVSQFSEFSRPRDGDGQFVANVTGGADPVTMRQAYGPDPKKSKLLLPGAAAAALAGTAGLLGGTQQGRTLLARGLRKVEGAARTGRDKLEGRVRMSKPGRGRHRNPGFGEVLMREGKPEGRPKMPGAMTRY